MMRSRTTVLVVTACVVLATGVLAFAGKWKPYEFKGASYYKFQITRHVRGKAEQVVYAIDVQPTERTSPDGKALWKVTTTTEGLRPEDELEGAGMFGAAPILALAPTLMMGNPMFAAMIGNMELAVGEKMSFFGAGWAKVVKMETVAGVEGFYCELYVKQGEEDQKVAELVVHPDLAYPLRSRSFSNGTLQFEMECLEYRK